MYVVLMRHAQVAVCDTTNSDEIVMYDPMQHGTMQTKFKSNR